MLRCSLPYYLFPHIQIKIVLFFPLVIKWTHTHCENILLRQYPIERSKFHNQVNLLITFFFLAAMGLSCGKIFTESCWMFRCSTWTLFGAHVLSISAPGLSCSFFGFPTRVQTLIPCTERQILNHWPTREVTVIIFEKFNEIYLIISWFFFRSLFDLISTSCASFHCTAKWFSFAYVHILFVFFSLLGHHRILNIVSCAIQRMCAKSLQSCPTLCSPLDRSLPDSSVHGILQARILEWAAMPSSWGYRFASVNPEVLIHPLPPSLPSCQPHICSLCL